MLLVWHLLICTLRLVHLWTIYLLWRPPHSRIISTPVLIIGLPEEVDDHVCNGIREETDRYISAGKVQKLIFDFSKTGFMDSSGIGILLGRYKRMHHMGGEVLVTGEDAKIRRLLRISGVYQVVGTL